ncbi:MAG: S24 family peptidase [Sinobacteraceae bacterium]|nr:S24 family peptidase [Nevskiaceae bacterium]
MLSPRPLAGFPSPAGDYIEDELDLREYLVANPVATFFVRLGETESMVDRMLFPGDVLVVDRSLAHQARDGDIVLADYDGAFLVKTLRLGRGGRVVLQSANAARVADFPPIIVNPELRFEVCGLVTGSARRFERGR